MSLFFVPNPNHEMANVGAPNGNLIIMKIVGFFFCQQAPMEVGTLNDITVSTAEFNHC